MPTKQDERVTTKNQKIKETKPSRIFTEYPKKSEIYTEYSDISFHQGKKHKSGKDE